MMLTEQQNNILSDEVYQLDSSREDYNKELKVNAVVKLKDKISEKTLGSFKILKVEDNQDNGMQAMAVAPHWG